MFPITGAHHGSSASGSPAAPDAQFQFGGHPNRRASLSESRRTPSPLPLPLDFVSMLPSDQRWVVDALCKELDAASPSRQPERQPTPPSDRESTPLVESTSEVGSTPAVSSNTARYRAMNAYPYPALSAQQAMKQPQNGPPRKAKFVARRKTARPRVAINRQLIIKASEELGRGKTTLRDFSAHNALTERHVRACVLHDGRFTPLGRRIANNEIQPPADRDAANRPIEYRTTLMPEEFALGLELIGRNAGRLTRTMFCELLDLDRFVVRRLFTQEGSLTERGQWAREAAIAAQAVGQTPASSHADTASTASSGYMPAASYAEPAAGTGGPPAVSHAYRIQTAPELCLEQLATHLGIAVSFWRGSEFRTLGKPGAPFLGFIDSTDGFWRIFPVRGKEYHLAQCPDAIGLAAEMDHIVNILRLDAEGPLALVECYQTARRRGTDAILVTPRPEAFSGNRPPAATRGY